MGKEAQIICSGIVGAAVFVLLILWLVFALVASGYESDAEKVNKQIQGIRTTWTEASCAVNEYSAHSVIANPTIKQDTCSPPKSLSEHGTALSYSSSDFDSQWVALSLNVYSDEYSSTPVYTTIFTYGVYSTACGLVISPGLSDKTLETWKDRRNTCYYDTSIIDAGETGVYLNESLNTGYDLANDQAKTMRYIATLMRTIIILCVLFVILMWALPPLLKGLSSKVSDMRSASSTSSSQSRRRSTTKDSSMFRVVGAGASSTTSGRDPSLELVSPSPAGGSSFKDEENPDQGPSRTLPGMNSFDVDPKLTGENLAEKDFQAMFGL